VQVTVNRERAKQYGFSATDVAPIHRYRAAWLAAARVPPQATPRCR
jgi:hypothetical protein